MSLLRLDYIRKNKLRAFIYLVIFCCVVFLVYYFGSWFKEFFASSDAIRDWVLGYGKLAPFALFFLQVSQVIIVPLNDFVINFAGGYLFGPYYGFLYNYFGWILGAIIVFWLVRFFGRKFVNFFISEARLKKFDHLLSKSTYILFLLFLLPVAPDDLLVYFVGLAKPIKFRTFLWIILIGKIPGKLATSFLGAGVAGGNMSSIFIYALFWVASGIIFAIKPVLWNLSRKGLQK